MPIWVTIVSVCFSAVSTAAAITAIWKAFSESRGRAELRLLTTITASEQFRNRVVEIVVSSDRIEAKMEGHARSVLLAELPDSETAQELKHAMQELGRGIREIESIFMRAGMKHALDDTGQPMARTPVQTSGGRDVGRAQGTPVLAVPAPAPGPSHGGHQLSQELPDRPGDRDQ